VEPRRRDHNRGPPLCLAGRGEVKIVKHREQASQVGSSIPFSLVAAIYFFTFICFFPTPALPMGNSTGLQAGQIVLMLLLPVVFVWGVPKRHMLVLMLLILPVLLANLLVVLTGRAISVETGLKATLAMIVPVFAVLLPIGWLTNKWQRFAPLLSVVSWAVVLHVIVGAYQVYWFTKGKFPLVALYQNPAFTFVPVSKVRLSGLANEWDTWAVYVARPFGLFPEPSAMAASIGPWLVLIVGLLLSSKLRSGMTSRTRLLLASAAIGGVALVVVSMSGYTFTLLLCVWLVALPALKNNVLRLHRPKHLLSLVTLVIVGVTLAILSFTYFGVRLDAQTNSSWLARAASLSWSLGYLGTNPLTLFFGVGPGQSFLLLQSTGSLKVLPEGASANEAVTAVWSVTANYILETGLVGGLALALVLIMVLRAILRSSARLIGFSCLMAWLMGVIFTTSYPSLLPIWLFLGVLLAWDRIFDVRTPQDGSGAKPGNLAVRKLAKT
jgi:hypothetical protein